MKLGNKSMAVKYRPSTFSDVVEQSAIVKILSQQIESGEVRGAYIFTGPAGTGKTTNARIFANEINKGEGVPMEMDAASHNGVDDVREIAKMAQTRAIDAEYKVFIIDECHMFSGGAWAAMLKLLEEPPAKCVFILCTTDYWKIPKTIQSRAQRFNFQRISTEGIFNRLLDVLHQEGFDSKDIDEDAVEFIARKSDGCLRDAITTMEKCLAYNRKLTMENVSQALGLTGYDEYIRLTDSLFDGAGKTILELLERSYAEGMDMKQYIKDYMHFILDVNKWLLTKSLDYTMLPDTKPIKSFLEAYQPEDIDDFNDLLEMLIKLDADLKWSQSPLYLIEATMLTRRKD